LIRPLTVQGHFVADKPLAVGRNNHAVSNCLRQLRGECDGGPNPHFAGRGQAQIITTKTLVIYGTGRSGGPPRPPFHLYAVDKATGKDVAKVQIPAKTTAVPMTFMHQGRQYIVFAAGAGSNTALVALTLPKAGDGAGQSKR